jgi:hypothetical protein
MPPSPEKVLCVLVVMKEIFSVGKAGLDKPER